ncbi:YHYH protein [Paracrocinitomix mangrovi]|uniref:YHYH protein n=1 Tax=Paracrocinitomix mangrovi TaxID=2862509 RepID=UPI001C8F00DB|nr:YHYH protein [Paracrocinitomix mangrovi]UKN00462.1 YHYH protein [Paracrocinitomix mangrovi]
MKSIIFIVSILISSLTFAHGRGHHNHENVELKTWTFDDGTSIEGAFSLAKEGKVYIETANHAVVAYPTESLVQEDEDFVQAKIEEVEKLNSMTLTINKKESTSEDTSESSALPVWVYVLLGLIVVLQLMLLLRKSGRKKLTLSASMLVLLGLTATVAACKKKGCTDPLAENYSEKAKKDDGSCTYQFTYSASPNANVISAMEAAFAPYAPHVSYSNDGTTFFVEADAIANHDMMKGITAWIDQFPIYQKMNGSNSWQIPIQPEYSSAGYNIEEHFRKYAIGVAANGIAIFNPFNATGEISADIGELDEFGGHAGTGDDYHYHLPPTHLDGGSSPTIIAYALDGFPVYGSLEPDGTPMQDLDPLYHGHEIDGNFHYHGTTTYPYMVNTFRGMVGIENAQDAPYDQITPQPSTQNFRGNPYGLSGGASSTLIDSCVANGMGNGYTLYYTLNGSDKKMVEYHWVAGPTDTITLNFYHDTQGTLDQTQVWTR